MIYNSAKERAFEYEKQFTDKNSQFRLARITNYIYDDDGNIIPGLVFYGESTLSGKGYKRLHSYMPMLDDDVLLAKINGTYVMLGRIIK